MEHKNDLANIHAQWLLLKSGNMEFEEWRQYMLRWANSYNEQVKNAATQDSGKEDNTPSRNNRRAS